MRPLFIGALVLACGAAIGRSAPRQPVPGIPLYVDVLSAEGQRVTGLRRDDFVVTSAGTPCVIQSLSVASDGLALAVVLLVDGTTSVRQFLNAKTLEKDIQDGFIADVRPVDRVRLGRIGGDSWLQPRFTSDQNEFRAATRTVVTAAPETGASPLWDAIDTAVTALESESNRRAVITITDGRATGNVHGRDEVVRHAAISNVSLIFVGGDFLLAGLGGFPVWDGPVVSLTPAASTTGGMVAPLFTTSMASHMAGGDWPKADTGAILHRILPSLRTSYLLEFAPPVQDNLVHELSVSVSRPSAKIRARQYYIARGRPSPLTSWR